MGQGGFICDLLIWLALTCSCRVAARCAGSVGGSWPGRLETHRWLRLCLQSLHLSVWQGGCLRTSQSRHAHNNHSLSYNMSTHQVQVMLQNPLELNWRSTRMWSSKITKLRTPSPTCEALQLNFLECDCLRESGHPKITCQQSKLHYIHMCRRHRSP